MLTSALTTVALLAVTGPTASTEVENVFLHEVTTKDPTIVSLTYDFPTPVRHLKLSMRRMRNSLSLESIDVNFGEAKPVSIPSSFLSCFPKVHIELAGLTFTSTEPVSPGWEKNWFVSLIVPFGHSSEEPVEEQGEKVLRTPVYPYLTIEFRGMKFDRAIVLRSESEGRVIGSLDKCPAATVNWSLLKS